AWFETNLFMKNQLLKDTDFMSMSHGIEVRVPFLDQNLIATSEKIENKYRFPAKAKGLLISSFTAILPQEIWARPKMGFTFPLQEWFLKHAKITDKQLYHNHPEALKYIQSFKSGNLHWSKAFALYQIFNRKAA
ncbi:MAG: hypothetical protein EOP00_27855, partial [Pedobacter sp.]